MACIDWTNQLEIIRVLFSVEMKWDGELLLFVLE